jgi:hypothetical protein
MMVIQQQLALRQPCLFWTKLGSKMLVLEPTPQNLNFDYMRVSNPNRWNGGKFDGGQLTNQENCVIFTNDFLIYNQRALMGEDYHLFITDQLLKITYFIPTRWSTEEVNYRRLIFSLKKGK